MNASQPVHEVSWTHPGRPELHRRGVVPVPGPWLDEPDKVHWIDPETDLDCLAVRNHFGAWCGYVGLPPGHPFHGRGYGQCAQPDVHPTNDDAWYCDHSPDAVVQVHGGLTYADTCNEDDKGEGHGICHVPLPGRPHDVWWLGFDTAHVGDLTPYDAAQAATGDPLYRRITSRELYRDLGYVKSECVSLARQLAQVAA